MANNQIKIGVGFQVDKSNLKDLESSLRQIQIEAEKAKGSGKLTKDLEESAKAAEKLEDILNQSWNNKLNQLDLHKVNKGIKDTYGNVSKMKAELEKSGVVGTKAYNDIASAILTTNMQLRTSNKLLDEMAQSMANTIKWGITSSIFNNITNSISQAYNYTKRLDSSLNDIRIVTDKSAESMEHFAKQANEAAKGLGASTLDYTEASLIYYQQGLEEEDVAARAETTLKAANVTGQYAEEVSEQLTAVWNGYKVSAQEAELYIDKLAAVATGTAADLEELSTGMSKVASAANSMGVDIDQLNAQLATIVSVTRQAPESVGTALKTIYARMSDLKTGKTDEDGLGLGDVSGIMEAMGIDVLDASGNLREMGAVIEDVAVKWNTWTEAQKTAMAQVMAGKRQYNNLVALFENWDMYTDALNMSTEAAGTLQKQQEIYLESTAAHLQQLRTEAEKTYDILFDQDTVNGFADTLTGVLGIFNNFIEGLGGGANAFIYFGSIVGKVFSKQITEGIINAKNNFNVLRANLGDEELKKQLIEASVTSINKQSGIKVDDEAYRAQYDVAEKIFNVRKGLSQEQYNETIEITKQIGLEKQELVLLEKQKKSREQLFEQDKNKNYIDNLLKVGNFNINDLILSDSDSAERAEAMDLLNKELNILKRKKDTYSDIVLALNSADNIRIQSIAKTQEQKDILEQLGLTEQEIATIREQGNIETEAKNTLLKNINTQRDEEKTNIQSIYNLLNLINPELAEQIQKHKEIVDLLNDQNQQYVDIGQKNMNTQKIVDYAMAATQAITALNGALKVFSDESSTGEEKAHAVGSAIGGIGGAVAGLIGGPWGIALSMIIPVLSDIVFSIDGIEDIFKSSAEKLEELNKQQEEYINKTKEFANSKKSLEEVADEYEELYKKAGGEDYDSNIENLTESERKRYNELKETILQYNQEALLGYNAEGEAILKKNQGIQETIDLLKEEYEQKVKNQFVENWEKTTQTRQDIISDANKKVDDINKKIANIDYDTQNQNYQASLKQQITMQVYNDIGLADADKQKLTTYLENNSLDEMKKLISQSEATNKDYMIQLIDNLDFTNPDKLKKRLEEEKKAAELELEAIKKFDGQLIANTIKYIEDYNKGWTELESLEIEGTDVFLNKFIDSLEYSEDMNSYDKAYAAANNYAQNLAELLSFVKVKMDPSEFLEQINFDIKDFDSLSDYEKVVSEQVQKILDDYKVFFANMSAEDKTEFFKATFGINVEFTTEGDFAGSKDETRRKQLEDFLKNNGLNDTESIDINTLITQIGPEYIDRLSEIKGLMGDTTLSAKDYVNQILEYVNQLKEIDAQNAIIGLGDNVDNLTNSFLAGEVNSENIVENKDFQVINNQIDELIEKYPELTAAAEVFSTTHLVGTQMWTEALGMLQDKINEVKLDKLEDEYNKVKDEILTNDDGNTITIETLLESDNFEDKLDKLLTADYAINVEIHAQAEQAFDEAKAAMENIEEQASKIGDDFIVAADDIRELNNTFPGIMEGMNDLHDGTVQLNKDTVKVAMEAAQNAVIADYNATQDKIKNAIIELKTKQKIYQGMADAATELAKINVKTDEKAGDYKQKIIEGLSKLDKMASDEEMKNDALVATNSNANAGILAENWNNAYQQATQDAITFGQVAAAAAKAAVSGDFDISGIPQDSFKTVYSGKIGENSQEATQIKEQQELVESGEADWAELAASYQNAADSLGKQITDLEGMAYELGASLGGTTNSFKGIASGKGSDNKKDSDGGEKEEKEERNKEFKNADDEIDRYWEINKAIETVEEAISDLDKTQEKLFGKEKIQSLKEENKLLEEQANRYRILAEEQRKEAGELQGVLSAYGVSFDAQGGVANYIEASTAALNDYNAAIAAYNSFSIDEATLEAAEKSYENFKSSLDRYESLYYDEMRETQNKLDDIHRQELENNLEAWEIEIQLKLDMKDLKRQWNEFFREINKNFKLVYEDLDTAMTGIVKDATTYIGNDGDINTITTAIKEVMREIDTIEGGGESDKFESISQAQEKLKELNEELMNSTTALQELREQAWQTYLDGIDQTADQFDDLMDEFNRINENIEYQKELIELLYGDDAYSMMEDYYATQLDNTGAQIDSLVEQAAMWKAQYEEVKRIDEQNGTTSEDTKKFYELWQEAQQGVNDKVTEYINLLQNNYKNTINKILDDLDKKITNGKGLEETKTQWELLQKQAEGYYDDVEKVYQLSTLSSKYEQSIANTTSLKNQQKLQKLYNEELEYLNTKKNLTEYDMEIANAKYNMTLKQIALEEAQQNKNAMKMTRGTDGNWSYQYVADETDVAAKQQELSDSINNYYQISKNGYNELLEDMLSTQEEFKEKYREIAENIQLTEQEKEQKLAELKEFYYGDDGIITNIMTEYQYREQNLADATVQSILGYYQIDKDNYALMTEEEQALIDGLRDGTITNYDQMLDHAQTVLSSTLGEWQSTAAEIVRAWAADDGESVKASVTDAYNQIIEANSEYQDAIDALEEQAEQDFGENGIKGALDNLREETNGLKDDTENLVREVEERFPKYREQINLIESAWNNVKDGIENTINAIEEYLKKVGNAKAQTDQLTIAMQQAANTMRDAANAQRELNAARAAMSTAGNGGNEGGGDRTSISSQPGYWAPSKRGGYVVVDSIGDLVMYSNSSAEIKSKYPNLPYKQGMGHGFATGGYTGEWLDGDKNGRLAWLHQKELVLNSADTKNILSAVDTVRQMTNLGNSIESSIMNNIGKIVANLMNLGKYEQSYQPQLATPQGTSENIFNIEANFPNANDVESIKEAILSLPNLASQYIGRNKR